MCQKKLAGVLDLFKSFLEIDLRRSYWLVNCWATGRAIPVVEINEIISKIKKIQVYFGL